MGKVERVTAMFSTQEDQQNEPKDFHTKVLVHSLLCNTQSCVLYLLLLLFICASCCFIFFHNLYLTQQLSYIGHGIIKF